MFPEITVPPFGLRKRRDGFKLFEKQESCTDFLEREVIPLTDKIDSKNHHEIMPRFRR